MEETLPANERGVAPSGGEIFHSSESRVKLDLKGVAKRYGRLEVIAPIDLTVKDGEFLTLLGPSGSGKTTLLLLISGLLLPDAGNIWIDGRLSTYLAPHRRDIGLVFQNYALFPHLSVLDNVAFPLRMRHTRSPERHKRALEALENVGLAGFAERLPAQLSGGQQQRVALARCLVYHPSIVLMDEPLGALDKRLRDRLQVEIVRLQKEQGITIINVTHDQGEALGMSDRVCLMEAGRIAQIATPEELYRHPVSSFAASFMGHANLISGVVESVTATGTSLRTSHGVFVSSASRLKVGSVAQLVIRPENINLVKKGETFDNEINVIVSDIIFQGACYQLYAKTTEDIEIIASLPFTPSLTLVAPGEQIRLGWARGNSEIVPVG